MSALAHDGGPVVGTPQAAAPVARSTSCSPASGVPTTPAVSHERRAARLAALWQGQDAREQAEADRLWRSVELTTADTQVSRCPSCREWRWRADWLPCQVCSAVPTPRDTFGDFR